MTMKTCLHSLKNNSGWLLALAGILTACQLRIAVAEDKPLQAEVAAVAVQSGGGGGSAIAGGGSSSNQSELIIKALEPVVGEEFLARHDRSWLGVAVEEASEALASQLNLAPGVGLLVTYITPDSPAAKAGVEKNDVLVEFDGQALVHPAQLRKLVQVRKEGDKVELAFYRAGKKQTASTTLAKAPPGFGLFEDGEALKGDLYALRRQFRTLPPGDAYRDIFNAYRDSLGHLKIDQGKIQEEVRRSMEQARTAMEDAVRYSTNAASTAAAKALRELRRLGIVADGGTSVTVRSSGERVRSIVKADESGTLVIVSNPKPRLTAHDKDGKLLFDGEIDTPEQRAKVPPELWEKVEPLLDKLAPKAEDEPEAKHGSSKGKSPRLDAPRAPDHGNATPTL
jgi:hypothetical protein